MGFESATNRSWYFSFAVIPRIWFFGLLRPREAVSLRAQDVVIHESDDNRFVAILTIHSPKNKQAMGFKQFARVKDEATILWLRWLK
eukprot:7663122-Karenia_brevis.AAC.1